MEAAGLGAFMVSACLFGILLEHPASPLRQAIPDGVLRRALMGLAMGGTAIAIIYSPWGQQSGAHINPSTTLTFLRLGKVHPWDAFFYALFQGTGAILAVRFVAALFPGWLADPAVNYVATLPGPRGTTAAFLAETTISFGLMSIVLVASNTARLARFTGIFCGALVALYITFEAPLSGMSMNPARTLGSAIVSGDLANLWIYLTAPPLGMLAAAEFYLHFFGEGGVLCAKLDHHNDKRCIFCAEETVAILRVAAARSNTWQPATTTTSSSSAAAPAAER